MSKNPERPTIRDVIAERLAALSLWDLLLWGPLTAIVLRLMWEILTGEMPL